MKNEDKRLLIILICFVVIVAGSFFALSKLPAEKNTHAQQLHVYSKQVNCSVTDVHKDLLGLRISIYNEKYDIANTFSLSGDDAKKYDGIQAGDTMPCFLYTWVDGQEIIDRIILFYPIL